MAKMSMFRTSVHITFLHDMAVNRSVIWDADDHAFHQRSYMARMSMFRTSAHITFLLRLLLFLLLLVLLPLSSSSSSLSSSPPAFSILIITDTSLSRSLVSRKRVLSRLHPTPCQHEQSRYDIPKTVVNNIDPGDCNGLIIDFSLSFFSYAGTEERTAQ